MGNTKNTFFWIRSSRVVDDELLERLTANAKANETFLGSILASSDTVEYEGRQMKQC